MYIVVEFLFITSIPPREKFRKNLDLSLRFNLSNVCDIIILLLSLNYYTKLTNKPELLGSHNLTCLSDEPVTICLFKGE
jgi:hypothetical protein